MAENADLIAEIERLRAEAATPPETDYCGRTTVAESLPWIVLDHRRADGPHE